MLHSFKKVVHFALLENLSSLMNLHKSHFDPHVCGSELHGALAVLFG